MGGGRAMHYLCQKVEPGSHEMCKILGWGVCTRKQIVMGGCFMDNLT